MASPQNSTVENCRRRYRPLSNIIPPQGGKREPKNEPKKEPYPPPYIWGWAPLPVLILSILLLLVFVIRWVVMTYEDKLIFPGAQIDYYRRLFRGRFYFLNSGGGLLHYSYETENHLQGHRKFFFLHGNGGSLDLFVTILEHMHLAGYDVYALEYYTYGICWKNPAWSNQKHISCILMDNLLEAWGMFADCHTIVAGFSLGGGLLGMGYNYMIPAPAQMVFINTFSNLSKLVHELAPMGVGSWITPMMQTKWITPPPTNPATFRCRVTIISTIDDQLMSRSQSRELYETFTTSWIQPHWIELDSGGHALSLINHLDQVTHPSVLLPCRFEQQEKN